MKPDAAWTLLVLASLALTGCRLFELSEDSQNRESVLRPAKPSPESVTMEVLLVRVPEPRMVRLEEVWLHADEQILDPAARRELSRNGFRVGVVGPAPPPGLAELLQLETSETVSDDLWQSVSLDKQAAITGHRMPMRPHRRLDIQLEPVHDLAPLFIAKDAGLAVEDFELAQALYALQWSPLPQGRIQIEVTPELHHGVPRNQYTLGEGHDFHRQVAKNREVFEQLRVRAPLSAGQILLISGDQQGSGSLGHFFHCVPSPDGVQHRIVLIRLAQVPDRP